MSVLFKTTKNQELVMVGNRSGTEPDESFVFNEVNMEKANELLSHYPDHCSRSAIMGLLDLAQRQNGGWLSPEALSYISAFLDIPLIDVYEIATFYTMYNLNKIGKHLVQVCGTTPCMLRGAEDIMSACKDKLNIDVGQTTECGNFTLKEVECLGACVNAPVVQINDDYYEDLTTDSIANLLDELKDGIIPKAGTQIERKNSAPQGEWFSLKNITFEK